MAECLAVAMIWMVIGVTIGTIFMGWIKKNVYMDGYNNGYIRAQRDESAI